MTMYLFIITALAVAGFFVWRAHREGRLDFRGWLRRASTWLGMLSLAQGGAMLAYSQADPTIKDALPPRVAGFLLIGMMLCGALTAVATSIQQKWLAKP